MNRRLFTVSGIAAAISARFAPKAAASAGDGGDVHTTDDTTFSFTGPSSLRCCGQGKRYSLSMQSPDYWTFLHTHHTGPGGAKTQVTTPEELPAWIQRGLDDGWWPDDGGGRGGAQHSYMTALLTRDELIAIRENIDAVLARPLPD